MGEAVGESTRGRGVQRLAQDVAIDHLKLGQAIDTGVPAMQVEDRPNLVRTIREKGAKRLGLDLGRLDDHAVEVKDKCREAAIKNGRGVRQWRIPRREPATAAFLPLETESPPVSPRSPYGRDSRPSSIPCDRSAARSATARAVRRIVRRRTRQWRQHG